MMLWLGQHPWVVGLVGFTVPLAAIAYAITVLRRWGALVFLIAVIPAVYLTDWASEGSWEYALTCTQYAECDFSKGLFGLALALWLAMTFGSVIVAAWPTKPESLVRE
jgi:hypothetical protein